MGIVDIVITALILGGASYLFYRSVIKKKGNCPGCDSEMCKGPAKAPPFLSRRARTE